MKSEHCAVVEVSIMKSTTRMGKQEVSAKR